MLTTEENQLVTRVGPGTPMGEVMRRYWLPVALSRELAEPDCAPIRVRVLGEDLVAFRGTNGHIGLIDELCPHRCASLFLGRNEEDGLRCVYHGWKFNVDGACVDMPNEPAESRFKEKIHITTYPTEELAGLIWAYMGPLDRQPPIPDFEWTRAPQTHAFVSVTHEYCNYLQCLEGGIDTAHSSFLHNNDLSNELNFVSKATAPVLEVDRTEYGFRYASIRDVNSYENYIRLYTFVMPFHQVRSMQIDRATGTAKRQDTPTLAGHMWVPIDDENTMVFNWLYAADEDKSLTPDFVERSEGYLGRGKHGETRQRTRVRANDWLIDRAIQRTETYTGVTGVNTQDLAVQESMGSIVDRRKEHLGTTDRAVIVFRQILMDAISTVQEGGDPPGIDPRSYRDLRASDMVLSKSERWQDVAPRELAARR